VFLALVEEGKKEEPFFGGALGWIMMFDLMMFLD
jgi:hypothetical protein